MKREPSSKYPHAYVALGSYRNSPFVTGSYSSTYGLKTEILDHESAKWVQANDYPFADGDRYVKETIHKNRFFVVRMTII